MPRTRTHAATPFKTSPSALAVAAGIALLAVAILALAPAAARAEVYHVKLRSGTTIDTAYQPQQASWDPSLVVFLADTGNWVGLPQKDIESVKSESAIRGFGVSLNFNTVAIGWAPNDAVDPATVKNDSGTAALQAIENIYKQQAASAAARGTTRQFVSTDQTGSTGGIPSGGVFGGTAPVPPPPVVLPAPAPVGGTGGGSNPNS